MFDEDGDGGGVGTRSQAELGSIDFDVGEVLTREACRAAPPRTK